MHICVAKGMIKNSKVYMCETLCCPSGYKDGSIVSLYVVILSIWIHYLIIGSEFPKKFLRNIFCEVLFWHDVWCGDQPLKVQFLDLFRMACLK